MPSAPWYRRSPDALRVAIAEALAEQPGLAVIEDEDRLLLRGQFDVREGEAVLESFAIEIEVPRTSSRALPKVWEVGGRVPRRDPHHVNLDDGSLCVGLPIAIHYRNPDGLTLREFLAGPLRTYLASQAVVLRGHPWPAGEWSHGEQAFVQFFTEIFGTDDRATQFRLLAGACRGLRGHRPCPCGSGKLLRACHGDAVGRLQKSAYFADLCKQLRRIAAEEAA